jgi:hypothetical protein
MLEVGETFSVTDDFEIEKLLNGLPEAIEEFSDPKSHKIQTFASLASSVSELASKSPEVASVQLVCGGVGTLSRVHYGELSPVQGG